jgi:hypothetical protein
MSEAPRLTLSFLDTTPGRSPRLFVRTVALGGTGLPQLLLTFAFTDPYERQEAGEVWSAERHLPLAPLGSWARYSDELALAKAIVADLGWTLSEEERALLVSLEAQASAE